MESSRITVSQGLDYTNEAVIDKRAALEKRLEVRNQERLREQAKRKETDGFNQHQEETRTFFTTSFEEIRSSLLTKLEEFNRDNVTDLDSFEELTLQLNGLQKFLTDSSMFLSKYDINKYQGIITEVQAKISDQRAKAMPKKKFTFRSKIKSGPKKEEVGVTALNSSDRPTPINTGLSSSDLSEYLIRDKANETVVVSPLECDSKDVNMTSLNGCTVQILGVPSTIHFTNLTNCTVQAGPCSRSIFLENCRDCTLSIACQQLRVHHTKDTLFYLHVTSRAIIEDSSGLKFAPYNLSYTDLDTHYSLSGLNRKVNNWNLVNDFNWLVEGQQSPNWSVYDESERTNFTI